MRDTLTKLPLLVVLALVVAAAMFVPAMHASWLDDHLTSRIFFYFGLFFLFVTGGFALATANRPPAPNPRNQLVVLVGAFSVLPLMMAAPFRESLGNTTYLNAYVEMVSSFTTTGATLFPDVDRVPLSAHLWRAMVGWFGGLLMWGAAVAILAPLRLGGFEVVLPARANVTQRFGTRLRPGERMWRAARGLMPLYVALTAILWLLLFTTGQGATHAAIHAMSTLATSGITALSAPPEGPGARTAEALILVFLVFAITRQTFASDLHRESRVHLLQDREMRLALVLVIGLPLLLFFRHYLGALEVAETLGAAEALRALWGSIFTVTSFLTTTGFVSADWDSAQAWSGLTTPGILLTGLAIFGGGVATTAGGVKLLRVYALYRHGRREISLLVHPSSVAGARALARRVSEDGILAAWVFFMLFAMVVALASMGFALGGQDFEGALILTISALSNTGPLTSVAAEAPIALAQLSLGAKLLYSAVMIVGRLEVLAIIALFAPHTWR